jgi:hypothetical protein
VGPAIAGLVDLRGTEAGGRAGAGGADPERLGAILPALFAGGGPLFRRDGDVSLEDQLGEAGRALEPRQRLPGGARRHSWRWAAIGARAHAAERDRIAIDCRARRRAGVPAHRGDIHAGNCGDRRHHMKNPLSLRLMGGNLFDGAPSAAAS